MAPRPALAATVLRTERPSPHLVRLVLGGEDLAGLAVGEHTDHYVKLRVPVAEAPDGFRVRTYTVRSYEPDRGELTLDVVVHGDSGVAGPWADGAQPGDTITLLGPGGGYAPSPEADWHLLVGDASVLPAIAVALGRIPAGKPVRVLAGVDTAERGYLDGADVTWVDPGGLLEAVRGLAFPAGRPHVFLHGEASEVRAVRRHLVAERGVDPAGQSISGYWKERTDDEGWRAEKRRWLEAVEADDAALRA